MPSAARVHRSVLCNDLQRLTAVYRGVISDYERFVGFFLRACFAIRPFQPGFSVLCPPVTPQGTNQPYIVCGFLVLFAKIVFKLCKIRFQLFQWQDLFSLTHRGKIHAGRPLSRIAHTHFEQRSGDSFNFAPESFCTAFRRRSFGGFICYPPLRG